MNISKLFDGYLTYSKLLQEYGLRRPPFPEGLSETLAGICLSKYYNRKISKALTGDLIDEETKYKYEIKCFSSTGPSSFGPDEEWNSLVFVDFMDYMNGNFIVYEFPYSNDSNEIQSLLLSKKETYKDHCKNGRRPHICFNEFCKQNKNESKLTVIFCGNINDLKFN
jgi:hypothetical protein